jgi:hypothetical protein
MNWASLFVTPNTEISISTSKNLKEEDTYSYAKRMIFGETDITNATSINTKYCQLNFAMFTVGIIFTGILIHALTTTKEDAPNRYTVRCVLMILCCMLVAFDSWYCSNEYVLLVLLVMIIVFYYPTFVGFLDRRVVSVADKDASKILREGEEVVSPALPYHEHKSTTGYGSILYPLAWECLVLKTRKF